MPELVIIAVYCLIFQCKRFPFDRRKPTGYLAAVTLQFIMSTYGFALVANLSCFGIGCYFFALSLIDDLKSILESISESLKIKTDRPSIPAKLTEFIQIHSMAKQLSWFDHCYTIVVKCKIMIFPFRIMVHLDWLLTLQSYTSPCLPASLCSASSQYAALCFCFKWK